MAAREISWRDILEVGQGGPGCGLLHIDGRQPKGGFRYLPPAVEHEDRVYASSFVSGGFVACEIDPVTLARRALMQRVNYCRVVGVEDGQLVYVDTPKGDTVSRIAIAPKPRLLAKLSARFGKR